MPPKNTGKRAKSKEFPSTDNLSQFALPSSLSCSEVEFPILIPTRKSKANWADILRESDEKRKEIKNHIERNVPPVPKSPLLDVESEYIKEKVFPYLIPALEETLKKAQVWYVFEAQKSFFNGIDHIVQPSARLVGLLKEKNTTTVPDNARTIKRKGDFSTEDAVHALPLNKASTSKENIIVPTKSIARDAQNLSKNVENQNQSTRYQKVLWNSNPLYPERKKQNFHLFNMPWVRESLKQNPRPYYPKSWLWPKDHAAAVIQASVRRYLVQRDPEVQEMREFWRKLAIEKNRPGISTNPLLAKKFALVPSPK